MTEEGRRARRGRGPAALRLRRAGLAPGDRTSEVSVSGQGLPLKTWQRPGPCPCGPSQEAGSPWAGGVNTNPSGRLLGLQQQEGRDRKGACVPGPGDRCPRTEACRRAPKVPRGPPPRPAAPRQAFLGISGTNQSLPLPNMQGRGEGKPARAQALPQVRRSFHRDDSRRCSEQRLTRGRGCTWPALTSVILSPPLGPRKQCLGCHANTPRQQWAGTRLLSLTCPPRALPHRAHLPPNPKTRLLEAV